MVSPSSILVRSPSSATRLQAGQAEPRASVPRRAVGPCVSRFREPPHPDTLFLMYVFFWEIIDESDRRPPPSLGLPLSPDGFTDSRALLLSWLNPDAASVPDADATVGRGSAGPEGSANHAGPVHSPFFFPFPSRENICFCSGRTFTHTPARCCAVSFLF
jgi:hypothetical protein